MTATRSLPHRASLHRLVGSTEVRRGPVDLVVAADVALKTGTVVPVGQVVLIVDPGRAAAQADSVTNHRLGKGQATMI